MKKTKMLALIVCCFVVAPGNISAEQQRIKVKVGTITPQGSPWTESLGVMKENLLADTNGMLMLKIYPSAQLGNEIQLVEGVQFGSIECAGISTGAIANIVPGMQIFELPFLWEDREEAYFVIDRYFRDFFDKKMQDKGMKLIGWSENGWRHFFTTGKEIHRPADLKGLKFRSQESKVHLAFWKALNANAVPLPVDQVYGALERGMINGGENTLVLASATGWIEVIKTLTMTAHVYQPAVMACNLNWYKKLPEVVKQSIANNMYKTEADLRKRLLKAEAELLESFVKDFGVKVIHPTAENIQKFRSRMAVVRNDPKIRNLIGEDVFAKLAEGVKAYKAAKK